ncbi:NTP pyrophosphatase (non-canonical NTP hydrolase) [Ancylobacter sp. 3268]|uniref:hypothetical protein n=1 Tax=Ancylobacter sp. 3268 TaxID=2817752 RepID=UPI002858379F|nr:hypothetical protein [Ancylobacter sp. 3268]MDR6953850.1 NTP pyrophosphatase (non-canonical NTP hydrolase) [Ancylobacter sp. 3268]
MTNIVDAEKKTPIDVLLEASERLPQMPELKLGLEVFNVHWGLDAYDPPFEVRRAVHDLVETFLALAAAPAASAALVPVKVRELVAHHAEAERYCLGLLAEEAGEIVQLVGKAMRFGTDTPGRLNAAGEVSGETPRTLLPAELGDMLAAVSFAIRHGIVQSEAIETAQVRKLAKLLDPDAKDNLGRPLAPQPALTAAQPVGREEPPRVPTQQEMNEAFYVDVCRAEDRLKEFITAGKALLETLPKHWHGEAETSLRDLIDETEMVLSPKKHHQTYAVQQAIKRYRGKPAGSAPQPAPDAQG